MFKTPHQTHHQSRSLKMTSQHFILMHSLFWKVRKKSTSCHFLFEVVKFSISCFMFCHSDYTGTDELCKTLSPTCCYHFYILLEKMFFVRFERQKNVNGTIKAHPSKVCWIYFPFRDRYGSTWYMKRNIFVWKLQNKGALNPGMWSWYSFMILWEDLHPDI